MTPSHLQNGIIPIVDSTGQGSYQITNEPQGSGFRGYQKGFESLGNDAAETTEEDARPSLSADENGNAMMGTEDVAVVAKEGDTVVASESDTVVVSEGDTVMSARGYINE
ncbi:hypothetical protein BC936DRAFT_137095 [Jimgerdemannia flammicorona]|uniref:Uncharacterized protein n=1 Tax=Jimgerdemannia flammicorona TaxID=994334 RepID=A0A433CY21_9FUNG|nr:hypothetical protein BC936DRAFT_137095 [Jimgerdemannia flammicorona]